MKRVLADIQSGRFVKNFVLDNRAGQPELKAARKAAEAHPIEKTGGGAARDDAVDSAPTSSSTRRKKTDVGTRGGSRLIGKNETRQGDKFT